MQEKAVIVSPILLRILQLLVLVLLQAALLFVSAGTLRWSAGWWYIGLYLLMLAAASFIMIPHRREVIEERSKGVRGGKRWDYWLTQLMIIPSLGTLVVSGLVQRWNWTPPLPTWLRLTGGLLFLVGYAIVLWAMYTNKYFSQVVRIQSERGHMAVTDGPYRFVRHPGYLGMTISLLGAVFLLDSLYGLACFALYLVLIGLRTTLEDRTLLAELPGYPAYASRTKFRLVPGLW
jgi:protein-S-isoprenylcysteine O-methyltransferase Ste14